MRQDIAFALMLQWLLYFTPLKSMTAYNTILWFVTVVFRRESLWPVIFTNTWSLMTTFYINGAFVDRTFFTRLRSKHGFSVPKFWIGDLCFHTFPALYLLWSLFYRRESWNRHRPLEYTGFYSLLLNMSYGAMYRFEPDDVYVPNLYQNWFIIWCVNCFCHIAFDMLLNRALI